MQFKCLTCGKVFNDKDWKHRLYCSQECFINPIGRFWALVDKTESCWVWKGHRTNYGHGAITRGCKVGFAHRYSWEIHFGPIPKGLYVLHRCDNPPCVRPDHLFLGTQKDNIQDCIAKGRRANPTAKLTIEDVSSIRKEAANGKSYEQIAKEYSVCAGHIYSVVKRIYWKNVP